MIDDDRLGKLLVQSGLLAKETIEQFHRDRSATKPPSSLFQWIVSKGVVPEARLREVVARADQYTETQVTTAKLGKFELRGELGRGGMGVVYRA